MFPQKVVKAIDLIFLSDFSLPSANYLDLSKLDIRKKVENRPTLVTMGLNKLTFQGRKNFKHDQISRENC